MADLTEATEALVIQGSGYDQKSRKRNVRLIVERDARHVARLADLVTDLVPGSERADWMEMPWLSVVFLEGRTVLAEYGLLSGLNYVRVPGGGDYPSNSADALREWLSERETEENPLELR